MTDTAENRRSAAHVGLWFGPGVTPNNSQDQEWRQQAGWGYSGILASSPTETSIVNRSYRLAITIGLGL